MGILRPQRDAIGRLWAEVVAKHGDDRVFNRARLDLLDLDARVRFHAAALPCPPDFLGVLMLPLLGAAIVAEPGSKKSPALDLVATPYRRRQRPLHAAYLHDRARYQQALAAYERKLADWKHRRDHRRAAAGERPSAPQAPILLQV